jgi:putative transcriptional regulator
MAKPPISNDIRTLRFLAGEMTQAELGDRIGVTRQTIAAAFRIARVFDKPLEAVFRWEGD